MYKRQVSSSETIDAMKISSIIGLGDKTLLKESLSQSLAKSMREKEIFADCFDNFFKEDFMNIDNSSEEETNKNSIADKISDIQSNNDLEALFKSSDRTALMTSLAQASDEETLTSDDRKTLIKSLKKSTISYFFYAFPFLIIASISESAASISL